jgi:hypothetical protein
VAAFTALTSLIRGWGNYYAYAAGSRRMDSLDAFIFQEVWRYCANKHRPWGAKAVYHKYTLPRPLRAVGYFELGLVVGEQVVRIPRLSSIPRKSLMLAYPPHPYLLDRREDLLPGPGTTDERWWDWNVWVGQEGRRKGQERLAVEVLARDAVCQMCQEQPATKVHHDPRWRQGAQHDPSQAVGVCATCHRQTRSRVLKSDRELR